MTRAFFRHMISALAVFFVFASGPVSAQTHEIGHWIGIWGLTPAQSLRVCISDLPNGRTSESIMYVLDMSAPLSGAFQEELLIPSGEFRCADIPYAKLVQAGLPPDPTTGAITFRIEVLGQRGRTEERVGANQTRPIGAVMSVDAATGKIETYEGFPEIAGNFRDTAR